MEITTAHLVVLAAIALALLLGWLLLPTRQVRHKLTRAGLRKRATSISGSLADFCNQREASESPPLITVGGNEILDPDTETKTEDLETSSLYRTYYLSEVSDLRAQFARRGIHEKALDESYESPESVAEIRTVSTGLLVMADRLR